MFVDPSMLAEKDKKMAKERRIPYKMKRATLEEAAEGLKGKYTRPDW